MTERFFIPVLNMSLTGSLVILAVLAMRLLLRKAPRIFPYCLWAAVLIRLLCPVSFSAVFSPLNALPAPLTEHGRVEYIPEDITRYQQSAAQPSVIPGNSMTDLTLQAGAAGSGSSGVLLKAATGVWLTGILIMAIYSALSLARLMKKLRNALWEKDNIYTTDAVSTPFVIGLIHPRIYLPSSLGRNEKRYILLHEQIHLRRGDHIVKIVSFTALCLHWFNPLVWAAFFLSGKDMEMSCDEAVIRKIGSGVKKEYTSSLLCLSTGKRIVNGIPLAFGEGDTGSRIKNVLRYRKPAAFVMGAAAIACVAAAVILLANPYHSEKEAKDGERFTDYGVIMEMEIEGITRQMFVSPYSGTLEIPEAGAIDTYFEPGDERDPHELLTGDMVAITFSSKEDMAVQESFPACYSGSAESITVMWQGITLMDVGGSEPSGSSYLLTFPGGVVPDVETANVGDILSLYWEETEEAYLPQVPESSRSRLIASTPILAISENEYGGRMLTVGLDGHAALQLLSGFGFHTRFALHSGEDYATEDEIRAAEEAQAYLDSQNRQEAKASANLPHYDPQTPNGSAASGQPFTGREAASGESDASPTDTFLVNIRSVSRSSRMIDNYVADSSFPYNSVESLAFAEDCVFRANYGMDGVDYREVSFDVFAGLTEEGSHELNRPCNLTFRDDLIVKADLHSAFFHYGISFDTFSSNAFIYEYLLEHEGEDAFETFYSLESVENLDVSDAEGSEIVEVYTGNMGDGDSGIVLFKDTSGKLLFTQDAHIARAGWNNIYLGEKDGVPFIMNVYVEDRWDYGGYGYWVYRLDDRGSIRQLAGSRFDFEFGSDLIKYDDELFQEWVGGMTSWLEDCHLILSSQGGEIRTEQICEADKYNYETLSLKDRS